MNKRPPHKRCSTCKEYKYFKDFSKHKGQPDGHHPQCKMCRSKYVPSIKAKQRQRKYLASWNRYKMSGFTQEDYDRKLEEQGGKCAICGTDNPGKMDWNADHCHDTGQKRGLLCSVCNKGLGHFKDDIETMKKAIEYLEYYQAQLQNKEGQ